MKRGFVYAEGLVVTQGKWIVLRVEQLSLERGDYACISGKSGSGKSTLLKVIATLIKPIEGQLILDGLVVEWRGEERSLRRGLISYIPQDNYLIPTLTVAENIALPLLLSGEERSSALSRAVRVAEELGIDSIVDRFPGEISGGEARRVAVARGLVSDKPIILADEPTASLDLHHTSLVVDALATRSRAGSLIVHVEPVIPDSVPCTKRFIVESGFLVEA